MSTQHVVVMGVSGSGKTTVANGIAVATDFAFAEADEYHSETSVAKMAAGEPLTDEDRWPWLADLATWMAERAAEGVSTVMACSALRRSYRDVLRDGPPSVDFILVDGSAEVIRARMGAREGHYMPVTLLDSQIATLEPLEADESGLVLDVALAPDELTRQAVAWLRTR